MPLMERVDDEILKLLNEIIVKDLKDPRLNTLISVTSVNTSKDLKTAKVYVSVMEENKSNDAIRALNNASAYIRGLLFERLKIRLVPHLTFILDNSFSNGYRIEMLLKEMHKNGNNFGEKDND